MTLEVTGQAVRWFHDPEHRVTLNTALLLELENFREGMRESLLANLEIRAALALRVAELQRGAGLEPLEAWHAGYQLGLMEALGALDDGAELIAELALERFAKAQN